MFHKNRALRILLGFTAFAVMLIIGRCVFTDRFHFLFLIWNLFLAWLPVFFAHLFTAEKQAAGRKLLLVFWGLSWLFFLPNAPYVLTDLFHLKRINAVPLWIDWLLLLSCGWVSLLLGFWSIRKMLNNLSDNMKRTSARAFEFLLFFLCAYGVYLGRYKRYNSWDVLTNPFDLMRDVVLSFMQPRALAITF
ncbi:MAG: DUF1361 domain-containing protein, partial [Bacteroidia bacterium]